MGENEVLQPAYSSSETTRIRDIEEKQRLLKERVLLIGQNLIELKERVREEAVESKKAFEALRQEVERLKQATQHLKESVEEKADRAGLELLERQLKLNMAVKNALA